MTLQQLSFLCTGTGAERDTTSPQWAAMQLHGCGEEQNNGQKQTADTDETQQWMCVIHENMKTAGCALQKSEI